MRRVTLIYRQGAHASELVAFFADRSPKPSEKVVDRLLRSPQYGERMAVPWMDVARYSDTSGYSWITTFDVRWRDWVIDAFNRNLAYDSSSIEQLAAIAAEPALDQKNRDRPSIATIARNRAGCRGSRSTRPSTPGAGPRRTNVPDFLGLTSHCAVS